VAAGRLLTPFSTILVPRTGYVALIPFDANKTSVLTNFIDWLVAEGAKWERRADSAGPRFPSRGFKKAY
jgi:hypothetical protein